MDDHRTAHRSRLLFRTALVRTVSAAYATVNPHVNLVVAIDLTKSVAVKGPDGTTEFQKNVDGVTKLLAQVQADSHVTVIGITDHSFAQPYILLSATVPDGPGYFGERLGAARNELVRVWKVRSAHLQPNFPSTDILGALLLASQIFNQPSSNEEQRKLVIFSDMRNTTRELNLESPHSFLSRQAPIDLYQVDAFALGVDGAGLSTARWLDMEHFWSSYLHNSGALLRAFSVLRTFP